MTRERTCSSTGFKNPHVTQITPQTLEFVSRPLAAQVNLFDDTARAAMDRTTRKRTLDNPPKLSEGWNVVKGTSVNSHHEHLAPDAGRPRTSRTPLISSLKAAEEAGRAGGSAAAISSSTATTPPPPLQRQHTHSRTMSPSPPVAAAVSTLSLPRFEAPKEPRVSDASEMTAEETHAFEQALQQQQARCEPFMGGTTADDETAQPLPQPSRSSFRQEEEVRSALNVAGYQEFHGSDQMPPKGFFKWLHAKWDTRLASLLTNGKARRIDFVIGVPNGFVFLEVDGRLACYAKDETARKRQPQHGRPRAKAWGLERLEAALGPVNSSTTLI